jgi:hypothetical protein
MMGLFCGKNIFDFSIAYLVADQMVFGFTRVSWIFPMTIYYQKKVYS